VYLSQRFPAYVLVGQFCKLRKSSQKQKSLLPLATKAYEAYEIYFLTLLASVLGGYERPASRHVHFIPRERPSVYPLNRGVLSVALDPCCIFQRRDKFLSMTRFEQEYVSCPVPGIFIAS
jgi:hypothetical protein